MHTFLHLKGHVHDDVQFHCTYRKVFRVLVSNRIPVQGMHWCDQYVWRLQTLIMYVLV